MIAPAQYILEEWASMCARANKSLHSDCPLLEDEVLVEMHKYVSSLIAERDQLINPKHKRADELVVGDCIKKFGEVIKIFQITYSGGYIKINFEKSYQCPEARIEMVYDHQLPEAKP